MSTYGNGATSYFLAYGGTYVRTCEQSRDNQNFSDRWVTKFSKVWGSASRLRCAGAPPQVMSVEARKSEYDITHDWLNSTRKFRKPNTGKSEEKVVYKNNPE